MSRETVISRMVQKRIADGIADQYPRTQKVLDVPTFTPDGMPITVWWVSGQYVRTFIDEEFTNFGQHFRFPYIPENEFWIDHERSDGETKFYVEHMKVEWSMMRQGKPYEDAIVEADKVERELRRMDGDLKKITNPHGLVDPDMVKKRIIKGLKNGVKVWEVDGRLVRSGFNIDFTQGGHEYVYEFVPQNEVWVDDDVAYKEWGFVIVHELHERNQMEQGMPYDDAHAESSAIELHCRKNPDELHDALIEEGWA